MVRRTSWIATSASSRSTSADRFADFAGDRRSRHLGVAQDVEARRLHAFDRVDDLRALVGQPRAQHVAREKGRADLALALADPAPDRIDRLTKAFGRRAKAAAAYNFQKDARIAPVAEATGICRRAIRIKNTPF